LFFIIKKEVDYTISGPIKGFYSFIGRIFLLVSFYNLLAIFPFVFSTTSHILVTLPLSFSLWLSIIIFI
jgi:F0F1-type ATP synthase membrane subunit a